MKLIDKFFKDFNIDYLTFIGDYYKQKTITYIKNDIKKQYLILQKFNDSKKLTTRCVNYWLIRGWSIEDANKKVFVIKQNWKKPKYSNLNIEYWLDRGFDTNEAKLKISEIQKNRSNKATATRMNNINYIPLISPFTSEYWINKGITDKNEIEFNIKSQRKLNVEYWLKLGYTENDAIKQVFIFQQENSNKRNLKWISKKDTFDFKKQHNTNIEYWLNLGYSISESEILLKNRQQTFTLEKCINKYGLEKGTEIYNNRQKEWVKKVFNKNTCMSNGRSNICDNFINKLILFINNTGITNDFYYGKNERFIYDNLEKKGKRYDLCYNKKIIEFNGDFWHSNPKIYNGDDIHRVRKIKCSDVWNIDNRKIESAIEHNYKILIIWESEYIQNCIDILEKCKKFLIENEN